MESILKNRQEAGHHAAHQADGRQQDSHGQTLSEWAKLLIAFGAQDALNLDGGGSSEIIAGGRVLNSPSDGRERGIGLGIVILPR